MLQIHLPTEIEMFFVSLISNKFDMKTSNKLLKSSPTFITTLTFLSTFFKASDTNEPI